MIEGDDMEWSGIKLTSKDMAILESYKVMMEGLADYLGDGYEFVLHSLENLDQSVIKIINGHHTGREAGAPITDFALAMLSKIKENGRQKHVTYMAKNKNGEPLKSTTIVIEGDNEKIIGLLCINFYMNTPFSMILNNYCGKTEKQPDFADENYASNVDELLIRTTLSIKEQVDVDDNILPSMKNKEIINRLCDQGVFKFKDSVSSIANILQISKNTVYMHLRAFQKINKS